MSAVRYLQSGHPATGSLKTLALSQSGGNEDSGGAGRDGVKLLASGHTALQRQKELELTFSSVDLPKCYNVRESPS